MLQNTKFCFRAICIRNFQTSCAYKARFIVKNTKTNVGIKRRAKLLAKTDNTILTDFEADPEFDPESDFLDVHKSHRQHELEMKKHEQKISSWIVYDKYFKQKLPNFLTWAEKEQIRHLHEQDPEQWSPERLCESFPADVHIIKKILKAKWFPRTAERVRKHDEAVQKNWDLMKSSKIEGLNPDLQAHLMKFVNREIDTSALPKFEPKKSTAGFPTKNNEFLNMINTSKKYQLKGEQDGNTEKIEIAATNPKKFHVNFLDPPPKSTSMAKRMTLDELQRILNKPDEYDETDPNYTELKSPGGTEIVSFPTSDEIISMDKFKAEKSLAQIKDTDLMKMTNDPIKEHIKIPKKLWKRGATYKVGDCFYDDDGEFLYRVPGMTNVS